MPKVTRSSGKSLVLAGLAGVGFFWLTDPRWGVIGGSGAADVIDTVNQASTGTYVGMFGGIVIAVIGLWLMKRKIA